MLYIKFSVKIAKRHT